MTKYAGSCPMTQKELVAEYFMEYRNQVIAVAAFLDRMDRSIELNAESDFRVVALRKALQVLCDEGPERVERIQMLLSDPNLSLLEERDRQNAFGAFDSKVASAAAPNGHGKKNGKAGG
jgi:hypothetical protein